MTQTLFVFMAIALVLQGLGWIVMFMTSPVWIWARLSRKPTPRIASMLMSWSTALVLVGGASMTVIFVMALRFNAP